MIKFSQVPTYFEAVKVKLTLCPVIRSVEIIDERVISPTHGYFRAKLVLSNGNIVEISEYAVSDGNECRSGKYRYQWMDSHNNLIKRWDNAGHFPKLEGYPHHLHVREETQAIPSNSLNIIEVIDVICKEIK